MECIFPEENDVRIRKLERVQFEQIIKNKNASHAAYRSRLSPNERSLEGIALQQFPVKNDPAELVSDVPLLYHQR